jgi:hypothetical protein
MQLCRNACQDAVGVQIQQQLCCSSPPVGCRKTLVLAQHTMHACNGCAEVLC